MDRDRLGIELQSYILAHNYLLALLHAGISGIENKSSLNQIVDERTARTL